MSHVCVPGGAGYVGAVLVPKLLARGHQVTVLDNYQFGREVFDNIRGAAGLRNQVQEISQATYDNIGYVGEWHSHPQRSSANASPTDQVALSTLAEEMRVASEAGAQCVRTVCMNGRRYETYASAEEFRKFTDQSWKSPRTRSIWKQ